ncbi:LacI family DNA-binding transcriptional regulator [Puniceibacterium sediminis]|nr:LacI family DNA-binding transcriptional regulator [Puniceibacterium sediminis]
MSTIARMAGGIQATVSRALNRREIVSPETLERIQQTIEATGYVPNLVAGALASSKSPMVAAVVPSITNIVYSGLIHHFIDLVRAAGYQTILVEAGFSAEEEEALVTSLISRRPDGILLTGVHHTNRCCSQLLSVGLPVVEIWDLTESPIDICVGVFTRRLARLWRTLPTAAAMPLPQPRWLAKNAPYAAGTPSAQPSRRWGTRRLCKLIVEGPASLERGRAALRVLLERGMQSGVIFGSSDLLAHGILIEAQARGLSVPADFSVIGFGDQDYATATLPPLTTVRVDRSDLGNRAADALLARINNMAPEQRAIDVGFSIITRGTTCSQRN